MTAEGEPISKTITDLSRKGALEKFWFIPSSVKNLSDNSILGSAIRMFKKKLVKFTFN